MSATPTSLPSARLIAPRLSLASCVRACLARSTMDCAPLLPWQRLNRFPASPLCSISWMIRGARNLERRVKAWAGQPMRTLRRMSRAELSFLDSRADILGGKPSWSDIAARGGYADQAHLCRETKEITGLSPTELVRAGQEDESYWVYRIWS